MPTASMRQILDAVQESRAGMPLERVQGGPTCLLTDDEIQVLMDGLTEAWEDRRN